MWCLPAAVCVCVCMRMYVCVCAVTVAKSCACYIYMLYSPCQQLVSAALHHKVVQELGAHSPLHACKSGNQTHGGDQQVVK